MAAFFGALTGSAIVTACLFWVIFWFLFKKTQASIISTVASFCITSIISVILIWTGSNNTKDFLEHFWMYPFCALIFMYFWLVYYSRKKNKAEETNITEQKAYCSLILGLFSLIALFSPIVGLPASITGLIYGIKGQTSSKKKIATTGLILSIIGIVLSLLIFMIGVYRVLNSH